MSEWIGEAKTAEAALAVGLKKLGLSEAQVDVKVLSERASGLLSMFGFRRVKVRLVEKARRFERDDRLDRGEDYERSAGSGDHRRFGPKGQRPERKLDEKPGRSKERARKGRPEARFADRPEERQRDSERSARSGRTEEKPEKSRDRKSPRPAPSGRRSASKPTPSEGVQLTLSEGPAERKRSPASTPAEGSFHPAVPPESLLAQWRDLLGWEDMAWEMKPVENHRLPVNLKTSRGERLAGNGGRVLEAFEYLFNLVSSGGDREKPWVAFRVGGFPSAEESRVVDKALFAAFQVRRTSKAFHLDPMPPGQRRAVHQTLVHHPDVQTFSEGEGPSRHVVVRLKEKKAEPPALP